MSLSTNGLLVLLALAVSTAAPAANPDPGAHQRYLEERAACMKLQDDDRKTCLREAGAAQFEARRGQLTEAQADYQQNKFARCAYHKNAEDRSYCERRMRGEGTTSGSVEGGGILRELRVTVPAQME